MGDWNRAQEERPGQCADLEIELGGSCRDSILETCEQEKSCCVCVCARVRLCVCVVDGGEVESGAITI